jgi:hypothetical protein
MKFIKLLTSAYVGGALRHPHEGVLHVEDGEADRLFGENAAEDVTSDFSTKENKETPVEHIAADGGDADEIAGEPHQSEVAPQASDGDKPQRRKAAGSKE